MLDRLRTSGLRPIVLALYALAMIGLGFAHQAPVVPLDADARAELAAFALPDGSTPDLCLTGDESGGGAAHAGVCDACLLTSAPGLGAVAAPVLPVPVDRVPATVATLVSAFVPASVPPSQSRGPPASPTAV